MHLEQIVLRPSEYPTSEFYPFNLKVLADKVNVRDKLDVYIGLASGGRIGWITERKTSNLADLP